MLFLGHFCVFRPSELHMPLGIQAQNSPKQWLGGRQYSAQGPPLLANELRVKGAHGICTETVGQEKGGVFHRARPQYRRRS